MRWRVVSGQALHIRVWEDEFIVYGSLSGNTHLLGPVAAHVLSRLQEAPSDAATLAESLPPLLQANFDGELVPEIEHLLADLGSLELIERA
ncbi:MAG: hypothetical protein C3F18_11165 [Nitrosomonadales bacterium]|nr:MAG: hypothetical protein C3F18_11165 [Nitrosomonadales bacterium]